jgi:hypothetical protein
LMRITPPSGIMDVVADRPVGETWGWQEENFYVGRGEHGIG